MTANYTGGGLSSRRRAKRRHRQDVTGTPAYTAAASHAHQARPGPLVAYSMPHSAGHRKGELLARPTFDFEFLRQRQGDKPRTEMRDSSYGDWRGGESFLAPAAMNPFSTLTLTTETLRHKLLAQTDWAGLRPRSQTQTSFVSSRTLEPSRVERRRSHLTSPDPSDWLGPGGNASSFLRGSSVLQDATDNFASARFSHLAQSTPLSGSSQQLDNELAPSSDNPQRPQATHGASPTEHALRKSSTLKRTLTRRTSLPPGSRWTRKRSVSPSPFEPDAHQEQDYPGPSAQSPRSSQSPQHGIDTQDDQDLFVNIMASVDKLEPCKPAPSYEHNDEMLSFSNWSQDRAHLAHDSAHTLLQTPTTRAEPIATPNFDISGAGPPSNHSPADFPATPSKERAALSLGPSRPSLDPYYAALADSLSLPLDLLKSPALAPPPQHLAHLRNQHTQHLPDSLTLALPLGGALLAHERMGLGCERLSRAQAEELMDRELALRGAGVGAVPGWVWGDEFEEEEEQWAGWGGDGSGSEDEARIPLRSLTALAAAQCSDGGDDDEQVEHHEMFQLSSSADAVAHSPHGRTGTSPGPRDERSTWEVRADGTLFAPDDLSGILEP